MSDQNTQALTMWEAPESLALRIKRMHELQAQVMRPDVDYGIIPGTKKPTLYKPGMELLKVTFGLTDRVDIEDMSDDDDVRYRVRTDLYTRDGMYLGCGYGECSSGEEKYKWRKAVCDEEWEDTDIDRRRLKYYKSGDSVKQIRTEPADVANTVLKMAKKRSGIDAVLNVLGASRVFNQDLEDMPPELRQMAEDAETRQSSKPDVTDTKPKAAPQKTTSAPTKRAPADETKPSEEQRKAAGQINDKQVKLIFGKCKGANVDPDHVALLIKAKWGHDHLWQLSWRGGQNSQFQTLLSHLDDTPEVFAEFAAKKEAKQDAPAHEAPPAGDDVSRESVEKSILNQAERAGYVPTDDRSLAGIVDDIIDAEFGYHNGLSQVPEHKLGEVFDWFLAAADKHEEEHG